MGDWTDDAKGEDGEGLEGVNDALGSCLRPRCFEEVFEGNSGDEVGRETGREQGTESLIAVDEK
jgi:hypothetical protein